MKKQIIKTIGLSILTSTILLGANVPNIGTMQSEVKAPKLEKKKITLPKITQQQYVAPMKDSGKTIAVKSFTFFGNKHIDSSTLQNLAKEFENQDLTFTKINKLVLSITKLYRKDGYFVARAYLPKQSMKDGILKINIIEGNYGKIYLKNKSRVKDSIVQGMLDYAKRGNIISTHTIERSMLIINDTPGVVVTGADVMPGNKVGTSDFSVTTKASKTYDGYMIADNTGSRYTGKNRLMAGININSPFKIGDKLSLSGLITNGANLENGRIAYSVPLSSNGLRGEISYSNTTYALIKEYKSLGAKGTSKILDVTFSYPILRTRLENLYVSLNLANKDLKDEVRSTSDVTKKNIKAMRLDFNYDKHYLAFGYGSNSVIGFGLTYGNLSFADNAKLIADKAGANTNGKYSKINLSFKQNINLTQKLSLKASLKMQYALGNKNLDGSEDFSVGGSYGVKLYPASELSAENGYLVNVEMKYKLPAFSEYSNQVGVFYDRGKAYMANNTVGFVSKSLQDVGVGYYASYKKFFGSLQVAWKANSKKVTSEPNRNSRILFQAGWAF